MKCKSCNTNMGIGSAIKTTSNIFGIIDSAPINNESLVVIDCWKCFSCGYSGYIGDLIKTNTDIVDKNGFGFCVLPSYKKSDVLKEIIFWTISNCKYPWWIYSSGSFVFQHNDDALKFKLRWADFLI